MCRTIDISGIICEYFECINRLQKAAELLRVGCHHRRGVYDTLCGLYIILFGSDIRYYRRPWWRRTCDRRFYSSGETGGDIRERT